MLNVQRRLAAQVLKCGKNRVRFSPNSLDDIKEAITKSDIRSLIHDGVISKKRLLNTSKFWARITKIQKSKSKRRGFGSRKGKKGARENTKISWIHRIRLQRSFIRTLNEKNMIESDAYHNLYRRGKGGFFRSLRHLKLYIQENNLIKNEKK